MNIEKSRKQGKKFLNPVLTDEVGFGKMFPILKESLNNKAENIPKKTIGPFTTDFVVYNTPPVSGLRINLIGHSSLLIEIDGKRILTDPVWSNRVSFSSWIGPKRFFQPPLPLNDLPPLDAIIVSHDHYDHLDKDTIKFFSDKTVPFICSLGVGQHLERWGIKKNLITELDWGDNTTLGDECIITATPSRHFSGRGLVGRNETLWSSFIIKGKTHNIFFGADSGWFPGFETIGNTFGPFDLTMLEIGAYGKYWPDIHMGPDHASNAHLALKGKLMMPIHWATFSLAPHAWYEPIERLVNYAEEKHIELFVPEPGRPTEVNGGYNSEWWKKYL